jgi:selenocysteine lyase/cysteine desulfurase
VRKLLLFLALLWSSVAGAMQSNVADLNSAKQDQVNQAVATAIAEQSSKLTSTEQQQAVAQAAINVKEIVDTCGDDKELLKATLIQRIKNFLVSYTATAPLAVTLATCVEFAFTIASIYALMYGINIVSVLTVGKQVLSYSFPYGLWYLLVFRIGFNNGMLSQFAPRCFRAEPGSITTHLLRDIDSELKNIA